MRVGVLIVGVAVSAAACTRMGDEPGAGPELRKPSDVPADAAKAPKVDPLEERLLVIAAEYKKYERVSDRADWAPTDCRVPRPEGTQWSASGDRDTHGRKLYFLYAGDAKSYGQMGWVVTGEAASAKAEPWVNPVGQVVVKEAFKPVQVPVGEEPKEDRNGDWTQPAYPREYAQVDGRWYRTGEPAGLFIMMKLDAATPETDAGWVYAVTSPDQKSIVARGRIASCVECHEQTTRDRLYGPRWSWPWDRAAGGRVLPTVENAKRLQGPR